MGTFEDVINLIMVLTNWSDLCLNSRSQGCLNFNLILSWAHSRLFIIAVEQKSPKRISKYIKGKTKQKRIEKDGKLFLTCHLEKPFLWICAKMLKCSNTKKNVCYLFFHSEILGRFFSFPPKERCQPPGVKLI